METERTTACHAPANHQELSALWHKASGRLAESPFIIENETAYLRWRARKLISFTAGQASVIAPVTITSPEALSEAHCAAITTRCRQCNVAFYSINHGNENNTGLDKNAFRLLCSQLGLQTPVINPRAGIHAVSDIRSTPDARYIPYTKSPLKWHTDGYYNGTTDTIRSFAMHCVHPAEEGGENEFFDPEILYILLRDENPDYIAALMHPKTLTVPGNLEEKNPDDKRPRCSSPVLALCPASGDLIMRYTQRQRYVTWRKNTLTDKARNFIREILEASSEYHVGYRLNRGEGVICNNIIHNRSGFNDSPGGPQRWLYRARYRERVTDTGYTTLSA